MNSVILILLLPNAFVGCDEPSYLKGTPLIEPSPGALADDILKKQHECEALISKAIDEILDDGDYHDFPIPDENYHRCRGVLDEMKRHFIQYTYQQVSSYTKVFPVRLSNGELVMLSLPPEEAQNPNELEFDVNEELCVTNRKCKSVLETHSGVSDTEQGPSRGRSLHCKVLLNDMKTKFIREDKLDVAKLKSEGGLSITCTEGNILLTLPPHLNNLDYYNTYPETNYPLSSSKANAVKNNANPIGRSQENQDSEHLPEASPKTSNSVSKFNNTPSVIWGLIPVVLAILT